MTLKEVVDTAKKIKDEDLAKTREVKLAHDIKEIQQLYNAATSDGFPVRLQTGKEQDGKFDTVIVPCKDAHEPSVDIDISLGVYAVLGHTIGDYALLIIETYREGHKPGDQPYVRSLFMLGEHSVSIKLFHVESTDPQFDDEYRSVGEALDLVKYEIQQLTRQ